VTAGELRALLARYPAGTDVVLCFERAWPGPGPESSRLGADQDAVGGVTVGESWLGVPGAWVYLFAEGARKHMALDAAADDAELVRLRAGRAS
jgi:hypothetical protein